MQMVISRDHPDYEATIQKLLMKARAINPTLRLARPDEIARLDPSRLWSFTHNGRSIAPTFVVDEEGVADATL
jgi:hypothetical protein